MHFELKGQGHPVVLMAGLGGLGAFWRPVMERLSRQHLCITFDHPGMGRSPPAAEHSIGHIATEVLGLLEQLKLPSAHFVGHSTGGLVAQVLARRLPQAAMVELQGGHFLPQTQTARYVDEVQAFLTGPA